MYNSAPRYITVVRFKIDDAKEYGIDPAAMTVVLQTLRTPVIGLY